MNVTLSLTLQSLCILQFFKTRNILKIYQEFISMTLWRFSNVHKCHMFLLMALIEKTSTEQLFRVQFETDVVDWQGKSKGSNVSVSINQRASNGRQAYF